MLEDVLMELCPSRATYNYWKKIGYNISEEDMLVLLVHGNYESYYKTLNISNRFLISASDSAIQNKLKKYINALEMSYKLFKDNSKDIVFDVQIECEESEPESIGLALFYDVALNLAKKYYEEYVDKDNTSVKIQIVKRYVLTDNDEDDNYIGEICFKDGFDDFYLNYYSNEIRDIDELIPDAYIEMPFPFKTGELVRDLKSDKLCLVYGSDKNESWEKYCKRIRSFANTVSDSALITEYLSEDGLFYHSHVCPRFLDYAEPEDTLHYEVLKEASDLEKGDGYIPRFTAIYNLYLKRYGEEQNSESASGILGMYCYESDKLEKLLLRS